MGPCEDVALVYYQYHQSDLSCPVRVEPVSQQALDQKSHVDREGTKSASGCVSVALTSPTLPGQHWSGFPPCVIPKVPLIDVAL